MSAVPAASDQIAAMVFAVLCIDGEGRVASVNPAAEELLGRSSKRLVGEPLFESLSISDERVAASLLQSEAQLIVRGLILSAGDRERVVNLSCSPMHSHPGWRVITISDAGQDAMEAEGDEERTELRAPAVLAHEIKNPLSAIRGASQLLARRSAAKDKPLATMIEGEVDRIAQLIDRMQQLGSRKKVETGPCNLHEAIRNAMATVRAGREDACELAEEFDPSLPAVEADQGALEQVLINLLANACDASSDVEDARIIVRTRFVSGLSFSAIRLGKATRLPIEITVSDPGPGLPPDLRDQVFEPFVSGKPHGQGLGLALVRKLLRDMGGRISHERDERAGRTHFRINLPVAEGKNQA
ncbi:two-component system sensor histidine kinase NtrB [Qipengyuania aquimaris]|uniref:two-component system sensor histidine kinase NtrB n=1 Tax=Qipengyuania aquimaris TaxID=255984 RepID=UPI001FD0EE0D|nr:ATP-binding protein [Qipengyuania aquimaris]UOR14838.1 ATP-binding protein [Qipengyuania aquimaris]